MPTITQQRAVYNRQPASPLSYDDRVNQFSPVIWLDEFSDFYQDAGTTPADAAGEVVGQWTDRSGNDLHGTASAGNRPPLASSGGVLVPDFDGTNHRFTIANDALWAELTTWTILMRISAASAGGGDNGYLWDMAGTNSDYDMRFEGSLDSLRIRVDSNSTKGEFVTTSGVSADTDTWLWATFDNAGTRIPLIRNPLLLGGAPTPTVGTLDTPEDDLFIGTNSALGNKYDGLYRAFILFPTVLSGLNMRWIMNGAA